jgi:ubiquinone/menaquinone biosynthesis C-methylase UbiE
MTQEKIASEQATYFGLLAEIGHTKHIGGTAATVRLAEIIDPQAGDEVLDVGCGVGIGAVFLAKQFGCPVCGVDITPRMVEKARERAERHGVADLVEVRIADMHELPFADGRFASAIAESVLTFSADKVQVVRELARVVRTGGAIAFTEAVWVQQPPPGQADFMARAGGMPHGILAHEEWQAIMETSGLEEVIAEANAITARQESKNQAGRASFGDYMRSIGGFFKAIRNPEYRQVFRTAAGSMPKDFYKYIGYGVYAGRKLGTD